MFDGDSRLGGVFARKKDDLIIHRELFGSVGTANF